MSERCLIGADWRNLEGRLTAFHSQDPVLIAELEGELIGGPKQHSLNSAVLFGIDPGDAKTHLVNLKGQMRPAYDAGKRLTHAFNYGMGVRQAARTFWLPETFLRVAFDRLAEKYAGVVAWRRTLADRVFGEAMFKCARCGYVGDDDGDCADCTRAVGVPIPLRFSGYRVAPARIERTAFGRIRRYEGRRKNGQNALTAQHPQSCGASMWNITFARLHGYDPVLGAPWPAPEGILRYDPLAPWSAMMRAAPIFVATGTYDSFYVETPRDRADEVRRWLLWTMEQPWPELDGARFPAEGMMGANLGKHSASNPRGLRETGDVPFTMAQDEAWH